MDVRNKMKNVFNKYYVFCLYKGLQRKQRDKGRGGAPADGGGQCTKGLKSLILRENVSFSAGLFFETVLMDVRNQMKNVFA